jgi:methylated-DNA-[protein]-cysteine S-methyltransferase
MTTYVAVTPSPLGDITIMGGDDGLTGLWFVDHRYGPETSGHAAGDGHRDIEAAREWVADYFAGKQPEFTGRLHLEGTAFRRQVWAKLLLIGYGQTSTYGTIAAQLAAESGRAMSSRAVGGAIGHNPVSLIVPCHRVIGAGGDLTGYGGGMERKRALLALEKGQAPSFA